MVFEKKREVARQTFKKGDEPFVLECDPPADKRQPAKRLGVFYNGKLKFIVEPGQRLQFRPVDGTEVEVYEVEEG